MKLLDIPDFSLKDQNIRSRPQNRQLKILCGLAGVGISLTLGLKFVLPLLAPFFLGVVFAGLIEPLVVWCETRLKVKRTFASPALLLLLLLIVLTLVALTLVLIYQEAQHLWKLTPLVAEWLARVARRWLVFWQSFFPNLQTDIEIFFNPELFSQLCRPVLVGLVSSLPRFPQTALTILLGVVSAYFFSRDKRFFLATAALLVPSGWRRPVSDLQKEVFRIISRFFRLECGLVLVTMALTFICLSLMGISGAPTYGLLAGVCDLAPVLGPGLIYLPVILSCFLTGNYGGAVGVLMGYFLLLLIRQVAELKVCGADLNIHPLLTLVMIYLGIKIFGLMGFVFGPAILIVLRSCYRALTKYYEANPL
jgi:sporulation integral membrane protein YtvI